MGVAVPQIDAWRTLVPRSFDDDPLVLWAQRNARYGPRPVMLVPASIDLDLLAWLRERGDVRVTNVVDHAMLAYDDNPLALYHGRTHGED